MAFLKPLGSTPLNAQAPTHGKREFNNGPVLAIHKLGPYTVVEHATDNSRTSVSSHLMPDLIREHGTTAFYAFYEGRSVGISDSLEGAVVWAVGYAKHHINSQLASLFMTVVKADGEKERHDSSTANGNRVLTTSTVPNPYDTPENRGEAAS